MTGGLRHERYAICAAYPFVSRQHYTQGGKTWLALFFIGPIPVVRGLPLLTAMAEPNLDFSTKMLPSLVFWDNHAQTPHDPHTNTLWVIEDNHKGPSENPAGCSAVAEGSRDTNPDKGPLCSKSRSFPVCVEDVSLTPTLGSAYGPNGG
ncbi:MAG: hypothetical protein ACRCYP_05180, partial [Alphaproteobacteria bacterium]